MIVELAAASPLERLYGIRDRFADGGSAVGVLWVLATILGVLIVAQSVARYVQYRRHRQLNCPRRLLRELIERLGLPVRQRDLLHRIARYGRLKHPATLLLSRRIFDQHARQWLRERAGDSDEQRGQVEALATLVFRERSAAEHGR